MNVNVTNTDIDTEIEKSGESVKINIDGNEYELIFTLRAAKEISRRYGGLEFLAQKLTESGNTAEMLNEVSWLITLLANQSVLYHNLKNPGNQKKLLTEEEFEVFVTVADIAEYKNQIFRTVKNGMARKVESEEIDGEKKEQG